MSLLSWVKGIFSSTGTATAKKMPTVAFDSSLVTKAVAQEIRSAIQAFDEVDADHIDQIHKVALRSVSAGRDFATMQNALMQIDGMTLPRASEITRAVHAKASSLITIERQTRLGITHAIWLYSNAPCVANLRNPTDEETRRDAAHKSADGKRFAIRKGLRLDGKWTWPGQEAGCKCSSRPILPGISD